MRSGTCPKCGRKEVHSGAGVFFKRGVYWSNSIPISFWSKAPLYHYVCCNCGYVESYVAGPGNLEKIRRKWPKVVR